MTSDGTGPTEQSLEDVAAGGFLHLCVRGLDLSSIRLEIENPGHVPRLVSIPAAVVFAAAGVHQDMVSRFPGALAVPPGGRSSRVLPALCLQIDRPVPGPTDAFDRITPASDLIRRVFAATADSHPLVAQAVLWAAANGASNAEIAARLQVRDAHGRLQAAITPELLAEARSLLDSLDIPRGP